MVSARAAGSVRPLPPRAKRVAGRVRWGAARGRSKSEVPPPPTPPRRFAGGRGAHRARCTVIASLRFLIVSQRSAAHSSRCGHTLLPFSLALRGGNGAPGGAGGLRVPLWGQPWDCESRPRAEAARQKDGIASSVRRRALRSPVRVRTERGLEEAPPGAPPAGCGVPRPAPGAAGLISGPAARPARFADHLMRVVRSASSDAR
jgi:hypothetical protein